MAELWFLVFDSTMTVNQASVCESVVPHRVLRPTFDKSHSFSRPLASPVNCPLRRLTELAVVFMFIACFSLALKTKPHCGFHCAFQCTSRGEILEFKSRRNHLVSVVDSKHAFGTQICHKRELKLNQYAKKTMFF